MASYRFKIILAGDEAVGKTSTILRFVHNTYSEMYKPTLGFQISVKNLNYKTPSNEDRSVIFSIWDIAGQGQFAGVRKGYYQATDGVLLLFDLTRRKTFEDAKFWADEIRTVAPNAAIILVGNKADLPSQAVLPQELTYASKENKFASYAISSAATGRGVEEIFKMVADAIINAIAHPVSPTPAPPIEIKTFPQPAAVKPPEARPKVVSLPGETKPPVIPQVSAPPEVVAPPVQRHPRITPQLEIKLPAVRNVPQAFPVEVTPVVVPSAPIDAPEVPEPPTSRPAPVEIPLAIQPVHVHPAPVEAPMRVEPPVASSVPSAIPVVKELPLVSHASVGVPETVEAQVPSTPHLFLPKALGAESLPSEPKKLSFWQRHFHQK